MMGAVRKAAGVARLLLLVVVVVVLLLVLRSAGVLVQAAGQEGAERELQQQQQQQQQHSRQRLRAVQVPNRTYCLQALGRCCQSGALLLQEQEQHDQAADGLSSSDKGSRSSSSGKDRCCIQLQLQQRGWVGCCRVLETVQTAWTWGV